MSSIPENKKPVIRQSISFYWDCPNCDETSGIEMTDDGGFDTPFDCPACGEMFTSYKKDFS